jgi:hypothetical protein
MYHGFGYRVTHSVGTGSGETWSHGTSCLAQTAQSLSRDSLFPDLASRAWDYGTVTHAERRAGWTSIHIKVSGAKGREYFKMEAVVSGAQLARNQVTE